MSIKQFKGKKYLFFEDWTEISSASEEAKSADGSFFTMEGISLAYLKLQKEQIEILSLFLSKFIKLKFLQLSLSEGEESSLFFELLANIKKQLIHLESIDFDYSSSKPFGSHDFGELSTWIGSFPCLREVILYFDREWVFEKNDLKILFGNIKKLDHLKILISKKNLDDFGIINLAELLSGMEIRKLELVFDDVIISENLTLIQFFHFVSKIVHLEILKLKIVCLSKPKKEDLLKINRELCFFKDLTKFYLELKVVNQRIEDDDFSEIGQFICNSLSFSRNLNSLKLVNFTTSNLMNSLIRNFISKFDNLTHFKVNFWDVFSFNGPLEDHFLLKLNERIVYLEIFNEPEVENEQLERIILLCLRKYRFLTKIKKNSFSLKSASYLNKRTALLNTAKFLNDFNVNSKIFPRKEIMLNILDKF